jgi:hypothetical protein
LEEKNTYIYQLYLLHIYHYAYIQTIHIQFQTYVAHLKFSICGVSELLFRVGGDADQVWHDLDGVNEALSQDKADDLDGRVAGDDVGVDEGLQDGP